MSYVGRIVRLEVPVLAVLALGILARAMAGADGLIVVSNPPSAAPGHFGLAPCRSSTITSAFP